MGVKVKAFRRKSTGIGAQQRETEYEGTKRRLELLKPLQHCLTYIYIHNITVKAALKFGSEAWVLKKREKQRLEAAQMKFLRHLLGITKLDKEKNQYIRQKNGNT